LIPRSPRARSFGHAEVYAALCAISFLAARFLPLLRLGWECPLRAATGIPCATCGMTRAFVSAAQGDLPAAFGASPLGALLALGCWAFALLAAVRVVAGRPWPALPPRAARGAVLAGAAALAANWAWLVAFAR